MPDRVRGRGFGVLAVFMAGVFLSAALLFVVQPMAARGLLPRLGGSPSVWTTAMLFFQAALLAGYGWAHLIGRMRGAAGLWPHGLMLAVGVGLSAAAAWGGLVGVGVGVAVGEREGFNGGSPVGLALGALAVTAGPGFFALASAGPLLQRWFSRTGHRSAGDPYWLYAASNAGSMLGLLGYPIVVEPWLGLGAQRRAWSVGLAAAAGLIVVCGWLGTRRGGGGSVEAGSVAAGSVEAGTVEAGTVGVGGPRWRWVWYSFTASSLMLGCTAYLSTDVAAFPLLWVVPLAIYLATFIAAFGVRGGLAVGPLSRAMAALLIAATATLLLDAKHPLWLVMAIHLALLAAGCLVAHARLAASRPVPERLTAFYWYVSLGGALGGGFNALVAPAVFDGVAEYPITLALLAGMGVASAKRGCWKRHALWYTAGAALAAASGLALAAALGLSGAARLWAVAGLPLLGAYAGSGRPLTFALTLGVALATAALTGWTGGTGGTGGGGSGRVLLRERTFFGVHRVELVEGPPRRRQLVHGTTLHGSVIIDRPDVITSYYHRLGPAGDVFERLSGRLGPVRAGFIGLGTGSLALHGRPGDRYTFFEIDPVVARIAADPALFPFLSSSEAQVEVRVADGRLGVAGVEPGALDLLVLDAFTSDAIPVHLLTREAFELYLSRLAPGGVVLVHLSNQHLDLPPVVGAIAGSLGAAALFKWHEPEDPELRRAELIETSVWGVVAPDRADLEAMVGRRGWRSIPSGQGAGGRAGVRAWTDDHADVLGVMTWGGSGRVGAGSARP